MEMARKTQTVLGFYGHIDKHRHVAPHILDCVLSVTWSVPYWLSARTFDTLKGPNSFEWHSSMTENECSQKISKVSSLESIILGFTLH